MKKPEELTPEEREQRINELHAKKIALLNEHGIFGGGSFVNAKFRIINKQLEALGVDPEA